MNMKLTGARGTRRGLLGLVVTTGVVTLSGCYVVPVNQVHPAPYPTPHEVVPVHAPAPVTFAAALYPANDNARGDGHVNAMATNYLKTRDKSRTACKDATFTE